MKYLPHALIAAGLFILTVSFWKIWQSAAGLEERPHWSLTTYPGSHRGRIVLPEGWRP